MYPLTQGTVSTGKRTIMAYPSEDHQLVVNYWSNPRMVLPKSDAPLGVEGVSDNAGVLTKNRFTYAATGDESGQCGSTGGGKHKHIIPMTRSQSSGGQDSGLLRVTP